MLPDIKSFIKSKKLAVVTLNFICLALFVSILFASIHYLLFVSLNFTGFSKSDISFIDFTFYSISLLFNSPISDIVPTSFITKTFAGIESVSSFLILVIFIAYLLEKYIKLKSKTNRKKRYLISTYKKRKNY